MAKVSIGLRGWRFEESDVFTPDGTVRPLDEMPPDARERVLRLSALVESPCDACWLIHGDEGIERCRAADVVYGEPMSEVVLCSVHEPDFLYWYREEGGDAYRGSEDLEDAFYEWFADGGRAPEAYEGIEHVDTDPESLPEPPDPDEETPACAPGGSGDPEESEDTEGSGDPEESEDLELDLGADYPTG
jgi:hypothetical protein